jgi:hypothetical protein
MTLEELIKYIGSGSGDPHGFWPGMKTLLETAQMTGWGPPGVAGMISGPASRLALNPALMDPKRFMTVRGAGERGIFKEPLSWLEQNFPVSAKVRVEMQHLGEPMIFEDEVQGLNLGHALRRAADNWPDAKRIQLIGMGDIGR